MDATARSVPSLDELYQQIEELPAGVTGEVLEPGVLRTMSRPGAAHRRASAWCTESLRESNKTLGGTGWWIEVEVEIRLLDDRLVVPDLAGWRMERVPELPDENPLTVVPDWCCEVLSPTTQREDRVIKLPLFTKAGVQWVWLVDPTSRTLEVYETIKDRATLVLAASAMDVVSPPPFDARLSLEQWWLPSKAES